MSPVAHPIAPETPEVKDGWVFGGLLLLLLWVPLPLGSNRTWALGILIGCSVVLLLGTAWAWRSNLDAGFERLHRFRWPLALLMAFVMLVWLQTLELPSAWVALVSPEAWRAEQGVTASRLSLDVSQTRIYAALSFAYLSCFVVTLLVVRDAARLDLLAQFLVWAGLMQAVIGVLLFSAGATYRIFFFDVIHDRMKGTFGYHNHFAGYMELCLSVGIGLMLARLGTEKTPPGGWRHKVTLVLGFVLSSKMRLRMMLVVLVIALVLSRSRMGNGGFFVAILVVGLIAIALSRRAAPATVALIISLIVIDVLVVGTWIGLEKVVERVQDTTLTTQQGSREESIELRYDAARHGLDLVRDFPILGTGGGSFYSAYIRYRTPREGYFDHAHNDYVELAADYGLVGVGLLGGFVLLTMATCLKALRQRRSSLPRGIAFGVLMAIVALAIHSTVDFNLQLPANALTLMVILAMGWNAMALPSGAVHTRAAKRSENKQRKENLA
jgi:O-antigen ligase